MTEQLFTLRGYNAFADFSIRGVQCHVLSRVRVVRQSDGVQVESRPRAIWGKIDWQQDLQWAFEYAERWVIERGAQTPM